MALGTGVAREWVLDLDPLDMISERPLLSPHQPVAWQARLVLTSLFHSHSHQFLLLNKSPSRPSL